MRKKTRDKLSKTVRTKGMSSIMRAIQEFEIRSHVHIITDPSIHKGMPHPRFHGKTGEVVGKRGRAFILMVNDGNARKTVIALPEHLARQKGTEFVKPEVFRLYKEAICSVKKEERAKFIGTLLDSIVKRIDK